MVQSELLEVLFIIYVSAYNAHLLYLHARMRDQRARERARNNE